MKNDNNENALTKEEIEQMNEIVAEGFKNYIDANIDFFRIYKKAKIDEIEEEIEREYKEYLQKKRKQNHIEESILHIETINNIKMKDLKEEEREEIFDIVAKKINEQEIEIMEIADKYKIYKIVAKRIKKRNNQFENIIEIFAEIEEEIGKYYVK